MEPLKKIIAKKLISYLEPELNSRLEKMQEKIDQLTNSVEELDQTLTEIYVKMEKQEINQIVRLLN
jgi:prefoldin subunit 5